MFKEAYDCNWGTGNHGCVFKLPCGKCTHESYTCGDVAAFWRVPYKKYKEFSELIPDCNNCEHRYECFTI